MDEIAIDLFSSEEGQSTPIAVRVDEATGAMDSLRAQIIIKTEADHNLGDMELFVVAVEDTVFYDAPNGEKTHKDVFRRVIHNAALTLASTGDSVALSVATEHDAEWNKERMYVMAFVQHSESKYVEQVASSKDQRSDIVLGLKPLTEANTLLLYPNPTNGSFQISGAPSHATLEIRNMTGQLLSSFRLKGTNSVDVSDLPQGMYQAVLRSKNGVKLQKLVVR